MIEKCAKQGAPLEPPVPKSAINTIQSLGALTLHTCSTELFIRKRARAIELRVRAKTIETDRAAEAAAKLAARQNEYYS